MRICFFGDYDPTYIRNEVIDLSLKENGVDMAYCRVPLHSRFKLFTLLLEYLRHHGGEDLLMVGSSNTSRWIVLLARILVRNTKPLVWDAHYSMYDTYVNDKEVVRPGSVKAAYHWFTDWMACSLADNILLDTNAHIKYFVDTFGISEKKFTRVFVGADTKKFQPQPSTRINEEKFVAGFHGKYIPLQGVPSIIRAAKLLEAYPDIQFHMIGSGQVYKEVLALAKEIDVRNVTFIPRVPYEEIPKHLASLDVSLGIFGDTQKAKRVIANKIYEAVAMGIPVISGNSLGIQELFSDGESILLAEMGNPKDIAEKILLLRNDKVLRKQIGDGGYRAFCERATPQIIGKELLTRLTPMLKNRA
jgi:glycosyltransferase involved in cell wall biosynthesis